MFEKMKKKSNVTSCRKSKKKKQNVSSVFFQKEKKNPCVCKKKKTDVIFGLAKF